MGRILYSACYDLPEKDSTLIVANLSDPARSSTWVQDLNRNAETHTGSTFIIGSEHDNLIQGGQGNDYLEGRAGNDTFRDEGKVRSEEHTSELQSLMRISYAVFCLKKKKKKKMNMI